VHDSSTEKTQSSKEKLKETLKEGEGLETKPSLTTPPGLTIDSKHEMQTTENIEKMTKRIVYPNIKRFKLNKNAIKTFNSQLETLTALSKEMEEREAIGNRLKPDYSEEEKELESMNASNPPQTTEDSLSSNLDNFEEDSETQPQPQPQQQPQQPQPQPQPQPQQPQPQPQQPQQPQTQPQQQPQQQPQTPKGFTETIKLTNKQLTNTPQNATTICNNIFNSGVKLGRKYYYPSEFPNLTRVRKVTLNKKGGKKTRRRTRRL
jgi:membrane-associated HD superfamily phosphohydrolase